MLVVDAGCLFEVLIGTPNSEPVRHRLALDEDHAAPHTIDAEVLHLIRSEQDLGRLDASAAEQAIADLAAWPGERFGHRLLLPRAWELRDDLRGWDALYVALAEALDTVLVTTDPRLGATRGLRCRVEVVDGDPESTEQGTTAAPLPAAATPAPAAPATSPAPAGTAAPGPSSAVPRSSASATQAAPSISKHHANQRHFDRWSGRYERDLVSRRLAELQATALEALELAADDRLLDVGCGSGAAVRQAAAAGAHAVGVDLSTGMIARAQALAAGIPGVDFQVADAEALPFSNNSFTALLCTTSLHHYPHPERAVAEMARVVKPGGRIAVADMVTDRILMKGLDLVLRRVQRSHVGCLRAVDIVQLLLTAGCNTTEVKPLVDGYYMLIAARKPASA